MRILHYNGYGDWDKCVDHVSQIYVNHASNELFEYMFANIIKQMPKPYKLHQNNHRPKLWLVINCWLMENILFYIKIFLDNGCHHVCVMNV